MVPLERLPQPAVPLAQLLGGHALQQHLAEASVRELHLLVVVAAGLGDELGVDLGPGQPRDLQRLLVGFGGCTGVGFGAAVATFMLVLNIMMTAIYVYLLRARQ